MRILFFLSIPFSNFDDGFVAGLGFLMISLETDRNNRSFGIEVVSVHVCESESEC